MIGVTGFIAGSSANVKGSLFSLALTQNPLRVGAARPGTGAALLTDVQGHQTGGGGVSRLGILPHQSGIGVTSFLPGRTENRDRPRPTRTKVSWRRGALHCRRG